MAIVERRGLDMEQEKEAAMRKVLTEEEEDEGGERERERRRVLGFGLNVCWSSTFLPSLLP
jgi:hypothetical protein